MAFRPLRVLFLAAVLAVNAKAAGGGARSWSVRADLDGDGRAESITLDPARERTVQVARGGRMLWQGVPHRWRPWKLRVADVLGNGKRAIAVGIVKATRHFPTPHNALFLYQFDGSTVEPLWLGSALARPYLDFTFARLRGNRAEKLVAVEVKRNGRQCVAVYGWRGFGFEKERETGDWRQVRLLSTATGRVRIAADGHVLNVR